jgi:hypothetical protein
MKLVYCLVLISVVLVSCTSAPSANSVGTAIAQTLTAQPMSDEPTAADTSTPIQLLTPTVTKTPFPTKTRTPRPTATPEKSLDEIRLEFSSSMADTIANSEDVEMVNMARIANGRFEIELRTKWASQDRQPIVSYELIQLLALGTIGNISPDQAAWFVGGDEYSIYLVTYSTDGDYRYASLTGWDTLEKLANRSITYDEWVTASNAGFR